MTDEGEVVCAVASVARGRILAGESVTAETSGLGKRERTELMAALGRKG